MLNPRVFPWLLWLNPQLDNKALLQGEKETAESSLFRQIDYSEIDQSYKKCIISLFLRGISKFFKRKLFVMLAKPFPKLWFSWAWNWIYLNIVYSGIIIVRFLKCKIKFFDHIKILPGSSLSWRLAFTDLQLRPCSCS